MIEDYYTETAYIVTVSEPGDFSTSTATVSLSTVSCAMNPVGGIETFAGGQNAVFADWKMFCSDSVDIEAQNRVRYDGQDYNVVHVKDTFNRGHHKLVFLKQDVR